MRSVLITGGTGMVGGAVLRAALAHDSIIQVTSLGRRPSGHSHDKLSEIMIADFGDPETLAPHLQGVDTVFHCLATYSARVSRADYETITVTYLQALLAACEQTAPAASFCLFSAAGARPQGGGISYALRIKGAAENALFASSLPRKFAFRPGYIAPSRPRSRGGIGDRILMPLFRLMPFLGVTSDELARAMLLAAADEPREAAVYSNSDMRALLAGRDRDLTTG